MRYIERFKKLIPYLWIIESFGLLDIWVRVMSRRISAYSIYAIEPNLFTLLWAILLTALVTLPKTRKRGRLLYGAVYLFYWTYTLVEYGAYLILQKFLYVSEFLNAGEGAAYTSYILQFLSPKLMLEVLALAAVGAVGIIIYPKDRPSAGKRAAAARMVSAALCVIGIALTPQLYESPEGAWDDFTKPGFEYNNFIRPNTDLELTGIYQFLARDVYLQAARSLSRSNMDTTPVDAFFEARGDHTDNAMSGILEGKNLLVFMMESMDDFLITAEDTPTLYAMMTQGMNFTNMYTPDYASGYTFNTEFAFNTGTYPYSNGNVTYALANSTFSSSAASVLAGAGYTVNSFHEGLVNFYNRGIMHKAFGYEQYHSYSDYTCQLPVWDDSFLVACDPLYEDLTRGSPFFSFVITYSAHLPYIDGDELAAYALEKYPQYDSLEDREISILRAKARLTDDMFAGLLQRLEEDGLLEDTAIVCFADHYAYGVTDTERLQQLSEHAGSSILERTPAFIYYAGWDTPMEVDKVMQTIDLGPTILNLMGVDMDRPVLGQDIFDENYGGWAIFPNNTWLTNSAYVSNGSVIWNHGMSDADIAQMNQYVMRFYEMNDLILDSDYYASGQS